MGEIRQALRAASFESAEPSAILDRASRLLIASGRSVFVTAIVGVLDPVTGRFAYATAGHPPPLVDDGKELRRLPGAGLPIGLRDEQGVDFALRLRAPCTLVMFTDGLMEFATRSRRRRVAHRERDPQSGARGHRPSRRGADERSARRRRADRRHRDLDGDGRTVRRRSAGDEREWRFVSDDARTSAAARRDIGALISAWTGREDVAYASELAFGELVANAVRHAPGPVRVIASTDGDEPRRWSSRTPAKASPTRNERSTRTPKRRGLGLVRAVADGVKIEPIVRGAPA